MYRSALAGAILAAALTTLSAAGANAQQFEAVFSGLNEVPPVISPGQGTLQMTLNPASLSYTLIFSNLNNVVTAAHIQFARARDNGGVIAFLCGGGGKPACPSGPNGTVSGTITAADVIGQALQGLNAGDFDALTTALVSEASYANIHTTGFPGGEIRGEIVQCNPSDQFKGCGH